MAESCRLSPVVFRRNGTRIEEVDSKLFKQIKEAVKDQDVAWKMWAYTKTAEFKRDYPNVEYDELGEVTFPSLIKALGMEEVYNRQKSREEASRDYGFTNTLFEDADTATSKINEFNRKEDKLIAVMQKEGDGYRIHVLEKDPQSVRIAREQSYNYALTGEIIDMLRSLGFDVGFVTNPRYDGLFDPTDTKLHDGLVEIIRIAKGIRGEEALPEEFAHLIIEGLQNHPLVQRLFDTLTEEQVREIIGINYADYYEKYDGDPIKLQKEAAGKLLAQYIKQEGTIRREIIQPKRSLLSRIWNWAKNLFSRITNEQLDDARLNAHDRIKDIYNLVTSGEVMPLIDKNAILFGEKLYALNERFDQLDKTAHDVLTIHSRIMKLDRDGGTRKYSDAKATNEAMRNTVDTDEFSCIKEFLIDCNARLGEMQEEWKLLEKNERKGFLKDIKDYNKVAKAVRRVNLFKDVYGSALRSISTFDVEEHATQLGLSEASAKILADYARNAQSQLNYLAETAHRSRFNILYNTCRTQYKDDKVRGIGNRRDEIMSLEAILEHAERDINYVDRWLSALSDADDSLLVLLDSLVKNQQYERDIEMIEWKAKIDQIDKKLRDAGYSSRFMYELDENGVPTFRIISQYDWDAYNADRHRQQELLTAQGKTGTEYFTAMNKWRNTHVEVNGVFHRRLIPLYVDPEYDRMYREGEGKKIPDDAIYEMVPNPIVYPNKRNTIENLAPAEKEYYYAMMDIKRQMMTKIPHRGQGIFRTVNISKDLIEGVMDSSIGNPLKATADNFKRKFIRRPDDIGFGVKDNIKDDIKEILRTTKDSRAAADSIVKLLEMSVDEDILPDINPRVLTSIINSYKRETNKTPEEILTEMTNEVVEQINLENFYLVETDFANHRVQKLPVYYTRPLKDPKMLSTDFTGTLVAYSAMAVNYEKMDEVVDILEVARDFINDPEGRKILETEGDKSVYSKFKLFGNVYRSFVEKASSSSNIKARYDDYMSSVVYEERKKDEGSFEIPLFNVNMDVAKTLDAIKDYTGLLGLGFNVFSTFSNIAVGKVQQWIEAFGSEYFSVKDYAKAIKQYAELMPGCLAEMSSPIKKNKLSLLIQMFDPMGDYFESLRDPNYSKSAVARILGNSTLAYLGMNAGEHMLHCQTMLAILNGTKLIEIETGKEISLFDALEVKEGDDGITRLVLKEGLSYKRDIIDTTGSKDPNNKQFNKNYGRPLRDENGKIVSEVVPLDNKGDIDRYLMKKKRIIRKVNDSLNGAFSENDKGAAHRMAVLRLIMQFRQWMPAHYMRRFARGHYDADLEQWREGYYNTYAKFLGQLSKDLYKGRLRALESYSNLSEHERANLRRATAEISMFFMLFTLCKFGGRVKDRDRNWLDKMALYQIHRMYLEVGASMPGPQFMSNIIQIMNQPAAAVGTFEKFIKMLNFWNMFDEVQSGRYQGWSEWERDTYNAIPALGQISKAIDFDESMFAMFEMDD